MKTGTFEVMKQNEMMAVNGGARSKKERRRASQARKGQFTAKNVRETARYVAPIVLTMASGGAGGVVAGTIGTAIGYYC